MSVLTKINGRCTVVSDQEFDRIMAHCIKCEKPLVEVPGRLPFYTVVLDCRMRRVCPSCFDTDINMQRAWMG